MKLIFYMLLTFTFLGCKETVIQKKPNIINNEKGIVKHDSFSSLVDQIKPLLIVSNTSKKTFSIVDDILIIKEYFVVEKEKVFNVSKLPLQKLNHVDFDKNTFTLHTKLKDIKVQRYAYKQLTTSQIRFSVSENSRNNRKLYTLFNKLIRVK